MNSTKRQRTVRRDVALGYFSCAGCGDRVLIALPIPAYLLRAMIEAYSDRHEECEINESPNE